MQVEPRKKNSISIPPIVYLKSLRGALSYHPLLSRYIISCLASRKKYLRFFFVYIMHATYSVRWVLQSQRGLH